MTTIAESFVSELKLQSNVTNVVGTNIYSDYAYVKASPPYTVVSRVNSNRHPHMAAASGLVDSLIQIDCVTTTRGNRDTLGDAVRKSFDGCMSAIGSTAQSNSLSVQRIDLEGDIEITDMPDRGPTRSSQRGTFTRVLEFRVWHSETVPTF